MTICSYDYKINFVIRTPEVLSAASPLHTHSFDAKSHKYKILSSFGKVWWIRQGIACAAALLLEGGQRRWSGQQIPGSFEEDTPSMMNSETDKSDADEFEYVPAWAVAIKETMRGIPYLPQTLLTGIRRRSWSGRLELLFAVALIIAFALSGHAAAVPASQRTYAISVDLLHLLCTTLWVGGSFHAFFLRSQLAEKLKEQREAIAGDAVSIPVTVQRPSSQRTHNEAFLVSETCLQ